MSLSLSFYLDNWGGAVNVEVTASPLQNYHEDQKELRKGSIEDCVELGLF